MKVKINVLKELIETEKSASNMMEDKISFLRGSNAGVKDEGGQHVSSERRTAGSLNIAHQDLPKTKSTIIQRYTTICIPYIAFKDEYLALVKCTTLK